ncbi:MAG TPA: ornithine cyclodeaminase family protein [Myxococcales bacterium]|nr:ornithine cyclodeaminase family protein [Myxococcales bacterium]
MTLLLKKSEVRQLLSLDECIAAVEDAFRLHGQGRVQPPGVLGASVEGGGFHVKTAVLPGRPSYFAAKVNGNFSANPHQFGVPAIQGVIVLADATRGQPLAVMDSIEITMLRTGAATAIAAKHLARPASSVVTICGCGLQGRIQLRALSRVLPVARVFAWDIDPARARAYCADMTADLRIDVVPAAKLEAATSKSDVCVTCTPSRTPFLKPAFLQPGTFVAAVGADSPEKQELDTAILASAKVVADVLDQCVAIGEIHHAIEAHRMTRADIHAELGEVVASRKPGRTSDAEITVFDSTGTALQDVAAAALVYERALSTNAGSEVALDG